MNLAGELYAFLLVKQYSMCLPLYCLKAYYFCCKVFWSVLVIMNVSNELFVSLKRNKNKHISAHDARFC